MRMNREVIHVGGIIWKTFFPLVLYPRFVSLYHPPSPHAPRSLLCSNLLSLSPLTPRPLLSSLVGFLSSPLSAIFPYLYSVPRDGPDACTLTWLAANKTNKRQTHQAILVAEQFFCEYNMRLKHHENAIINFPAQIHSSTCTCGWCLFAAIVFSLEVLADD